MNEDRLERLQYFYPKREDRVRIALNDTNVEIGTVTWDDRLIVLHTDGWKTKSTRLRMNQVSEVYNLGYRIWQKEWVWYVDWKGRTFEWLSKDQKDIPCTLWR